MFDFEESGAFKLAFRSSVGLRGGRLCAIYSPRLRQSLCHLFSQADLQTTPFVPMVLP